MILSYMYLLGIIKHLRMARDSDTVKSRAGILCSQLLCNMTSRELLKFDYGFMRVFQ